MFDIDGHIRPFPNALPAEMLGNMLTEFFMA